MPTRLRRSGALLAVPAAVLLASCGPGQASPAAQTSASSATSTTPSSTPTTSSAAPTSAAPPAAAAPKRSKASLEKALLGIDDLPAGFSVEPADQSGEGGPAVSSKDPRCKTLVTIMNADSAPGATANAATSFSGGQDGPWIDEQLAAMGGAERVSAFHAQVRAAVKACSKLTLRLPQGTSTMAVRTVKAPTIGKDPVAFRISAQGGPLDGFESTQVATGVGDVELMMSFLGAVPDDIDGGTQVAFDKAEQTLGVKASSVS
ncbi:hypothetical protein [Terrabacter carboxydivorans]|uniref:hypothetical protein n=1 Tax=Terrabacter carboxydivorans TaxID=619730 RepID=UPI0031D7A1DE